MDSRIVRSGKSVYDSTPNTSPSPANEAVIAGGVRAECVRQTAPGCSRLQHPEDAFEDTTVNSGEPHAACRAASV
jgi:hypothetical protein